MNDHKPNISVDHQHLYYSDGIHKLKLWVEWSAVAKTEDCPIDFEVQATNLTTWTEPAGEPIDPVRREEVLDEIAEYYSKAPAADITGKRGELLRGVSKYRFSLQIFPTPSRYYEVGRFLSIPMLQPARDARAWNERYVLDFRGITHWTSPSIPLEPGRLEEIARRIVKKERLGYVGVSIAAG